MVANLAEGLDAEAHLASTRVMIMNAPDSTFMLYLGLLRHVTGRPVPRAITPLAAGTRGMTVARTGERTLRVRQDDGFIVRSTERLTHDNTPAWQVGARVQLTGLAIDVVEVTPDGRPLSVEVRFEQPLDHPSLRFTVWDGHTLVPFALPAIGESQRIAAQELFGGRRAAGGRSLASLP